MESLLKKTMMNKQEKVIYLINTLEELYPKTPIPLNHKDPYTLLIAVLLSAQCTDERVNQVTPILFSLAKNPKEMSELSVDKIYEIIKPCGLGPQKSKAIHKLSNMHFSMPLRVAIDPIHPYTSRRPSCRCLCLFRSPFSIRVL